ncbi:unnamed protein product [Tilletia controversa]|nr:unnamed protein product [Tilletia controversa]CAD6979014.1 unnamed protein product [Tilletia controversa]
MSASASTTASAPSPFIGKRVHLSLTSGGSYTGAITALNPTTRALQIRDDRTTAIFSIRADEVQDMRFLNDEEQQQRPLPTPAQSATSATSSSFMRPLEPLPADFHAETAPTMADSRALDEEQDPSSTTTASATAGTAGNSKKRRAERRKKKASATTAEGAAADAGDGPNGSGEPASKLGFQEDFDFEGALKTFDKAKIWEEIRRADQTDPDTLLVSHNRIGGGQSGAVPLKRGPNGVGPSNAVPMSSRFESGDEEEEGVNNGGASNQYNGSPRRNGGAASSRLAHRKNGQTKLGIHEMVISPTASGDEEEDEEGDNAGAKATKRASAPSSPSASSSAPLGDESTAGPESPTTNGEGLLNSLMASAAARMSGFASAARSAIGGTPSSSTQTTAANNGISQQHDHERAEDDEDESILIPSSSLVVPPPTTVTTAAPAAASLKLENESSASASASLSTKETKGQSSNTVAELQDEVSRLLERISVLEALGGVEVKEATAEEGRVLPSPSSATTTASAGTRRYTCTVRPTGPGEPSGALRFGLSTTFAHSKTNMPTPTPTSAPRLKNMRYLGALPAPAHSDADAKEALPAKYANPMGLSAESAGVFVRRLRDGVYGPGR